MEHEQQWKIFEDYIGRFPDGKVFYSESLRLIVPYLSELNSENLTEPKYFNTNIRLFLDGIIKFFCQIHNTHKKAKIIYNNYRSKGHQYCLYLRNFSLSGRILNTDFEDNVSRSGFAMSDGKFRELIKKLIKTQINTLSFINTHDLHLLSSYSTIPSFRVLSHNWQTVVSEVIKGANFIILNVENKTQGIDFEIDAIQKSGMLQRTICVIPDRENEYLKYYDDFFDVIELHHWNYDSKKSSSFLRLQESIKHLVNDDFRQTSQVQDLSHLKCHLIDKNIELAEMQFDELILDIPYESFIPSSLLSNWKLLSNDFPLMIRNWLEIEEIIKANKRLDLQLLVDVMYLALGNFMVAVTIERYYEMSISIATVGIAHNLITKQKEIMRDCYKYAAHCAKWNDDIPSAKYYGNIYKKLNT